MYRPLVSDRQEIRILHLQSDEYIRNCNRAFRHTRGRADRQAVQCTDTLLRGELEVVSLLTNPKPQYEALSYCWEEVSGIEKICVNGLMIKAPASAAKVLRRFRPQQGRRSLWIDAICINQDDMGERNQQVGLTGKIYHGTIRTLIWLGDPDETDDIAISDIKFLVNDVYPRYVRTSNGIRLSEQAPSLASGGYQMARFFGRPWFNRVWVLQEAVLAPIATC